MDFKQEDDTKKGRFFYEEDRSGNTEITYVYAGPQKIIISHTGVSEAYKGKNIGKQLVNAVADFVRANNIKIIPITLPDNKKVFPKEYFKGRPGIVRIKIHAPIDPNSFSENSIENLNTSVYNTIFEQLNNYE